MKTHLLLIAITFGALQMFAQIAPSDFIFQTTDNYEFSGTSGINPSLSDARFEPGNGDFSFRVAFTPKATTNLQFIIDKGNGPHSANPGWCLAYENNNLYLRIGGNRNGTITKSIVQMPFIIANYLNQEVVVAGTMERSTGEVHLYLNGDKSTEIFPTANTFGATHTLMTSDFSISNATFPLTLGSRSDAKHIFTGTISDFKTYNHVLSTTQMTTPPADYLFSRSETMEFSGTNYEAISDFYPNTGSMTILFCIVPKITSAGTAIKNIAGSGNTTSTGSGWNIMMGEGYIGFRTTSTTTTGNYRASARIPFADATYLNREVFGAAVIDRANNKVDFYIDGTNANTEHGGYGPTSNILDADKKIISTSKFSLGQNSADGSRFTGTLKSLSIYHRVLSASELSAWKTTFTFTGTGNWTETARWSTGILPDASTNINVDGTLTINTAALSANINVQTGSQLTITPGNSLTVAPGKQLSVSGTFTNNGTIILQSNTSGTATVTGNVSGNATVEQYLPAATERTWWYLASPVTGAAWTVFGSNQVGEYSETSRSYSAPFAATETLTAGKGYVVKMNAAQAANVYQFANKALNNGNISVPLTRTVSETLNNKRGFNLVGNPYPSYLNWELAHKASTNVRSTIWYRTKGASAMEFHTYNAALGVSVPTAASGYIPPMQAFWVKVDADPVSPASVSNGTLNFTNAMRGHAIQGTTTPLKAPAANSLPLLRIALSNGSTSDETVIALHQNASANFDQYDSEKMSNTGTSEVFTLAGTQELTINAQPDSEGSKLIPLGIRPANAGSLNLSVSELKNLDNMQIILHDNVLKTETQLSLNESYHFTTDGTATNNRFSIEFRAPGMTTGLDNSDFADFNITVYSGKIQIQSPPITNGELIRVYSSNGQKIIEQRAEGNNTIIDHKLSSGVYFVKVSNYVQKIIIH